MRAEIVNAIAEKRIVELRYHGYARIVEPHAYGRDKNGDEVLRCYQVSGGSDSGERTGWKLLKVSEVYSSDVLKQHFAVRNDFRRGDKAMQHIFAQA